MEFVDELLGMSSSSRVSPELLETLGRKASQMFQQKGISLNQAIATVTAEHPELGNEHVKRVVEFANNATFQELFEKSTDKNVHFPVADPGVVLRDLKDGGSPAHDGKTMNGGFGDYQTPPKESAMPEVEQMFTESFAPNAEGGTTDQLTTKMASVQWDEADRHNYHANPIDDLHELKIRLEASKEKLAEAHERFDLLLKTAKQEFYDAVKHEVLDPDGAGLGGVIGALRKVASENLIAGVMETMVPMLLEEVPPRVVQRSFEKRAGAVVNFEHPLLQSWAGMQKAAEEVLRARQALDDVDGYLQKTSGALTTAVKKSLGGKSPVPGAIRQRFPRT